MQCSKCNSGELRRIKRTGLWQKFILPLLDYYPWECPQCRVVQIVKHRADHHSDGHPHSASNKNKS